MSQSTIRWGAVAALLTAVVAWFLFSRGDAPQPGSSESTKGGPVAPTLPQVEPIEPPAVTVTKSVGIPTPESEIERHKAIDKEHLQKIFAGLEAFAARHGRYPDYLSELVPDFVAAETLESPRGEDDGMNYLLNLDHQDPGVKNPSYGYEFSNLERGERTFQEVKTVQRAEWGEVVPVLRAFGYDKVLNMSWRGDIYETDLMWEHDEATLDLIDLYGWGEGMVSDREVSVIVSDQNGQPLAGAEVWADGRTYSFPLPERPFITDENGIARVPVSEDFDRDSLALRLEAPGHAAEPIRFEPGAAPGAVELVAQRSQPVSGTLTDAGGNPLADTRVVLVGKPAEDGTAPLVGYTRTDAAGRWTADALPADAANITAHPRFPKK